MTMTEDVLIKALEVAETNMAAFYTILAEHKVHVGNLCSLSKDQLPIEKYEIPIPELLVTITLYVDNDKFVENDRVTGLVPYKPEKTNADSSTT